MPPFPVVIHLHVLEDRFPSLLMAAIHAAIHQLTLQGLKKALYHGIVPTIPLPTHAAQHLVVLQSTLKQVAGVLASPVAVVNEASRRIPPAHRHVQRSQRQFSSHGVIHRPTHNRPGKQIHGYGQIEPALFGGDVGDIARPDGIRRLRREVSVEQIWCNWKAMPAVGGFDELASGFAVQAEIAHQSSNPTDAVMVIQLSEFNLNPGRSIAPFVLIINVLNQEFEVFILSFPR